MPDQRRFNCNHGAGIGNAVRGGEYGRATQAVADQDRRRSIGLSQMIGGGHEIVDVGREMRIGKLALAHAEAGEIEAQNAYAANGQPFGNPLGRQIVLAAGEAMRKQRESRRFAERKIDQGCQLLAFRVGEFNSFGAHGVYLFLISHPIILRPGNRHKVPKNGAFAQE